MTTQPTLFEVGSPTPGLRRVRELRVGAPGAGDRDRLGRHAANVLNRLRLAPVTNAELHDSPDIYGTLPTHRMYEVRRYLKHTHEAVKITRLGGGVNRYEIVNL